MFTVRCRIFQTPTPTDIEVLDVVVAVEEGVITAVTEASDYMGTIDVELAQDQVLVPGFVDLHIHAPQWPQLGTGYDVPLDQWLFDYTFPTEAKFADVNYARTVWDDMVPTPVSYTHLTLPTICSV